MPSSVAIVTTLGTDGVVQGMTISSLLSVSLEPHTLLISLARGSRSEEVVGAGGAFSVSVLAEGQEDIATEFSRIGAVRPLGVLVPTVVEGSVHYSVTGATVSFACSVSRLMEAGDHTLVLGAVRQVTLRPGAPLVRWQGSFTIPGSPDSCPPGERAETRDPVLQL